MSDFKSTAAIGARWVLVLPAAVGAFFGVQLFITFCNATMAEGYSDWFLQLINSGAGSYCFVYAGGRTAPKYRLIVGIVLAALFGIFTVVVATLSAVLPLKSHSFWWIALTGAVGLTTSIFAVVKLREDEDDEVKAKPVTLPIPDSEEKPICLHDDEGPEIIIDDDAALPLCRHYDDGIPDDAGVEEQIDIGLYASDEGDLPATLNAFKKAVELDPYSPWARYNYGIVLSFADKHPDALKQYRAT